ncbi:MAG: ATP-binding protein [Candidatus Gracilibacteria bacterium]|nr:ATP-binding protein [Candidatus Gracilibacteria bacterium]
MNRKNLRIAIIGSHGTGKTTLVEKLGDLFKIPVIEEMARTVIMEKNKLPHDMDDSERFIFQQTIFDRQTVHEDILDSFISDRSVLDALVYAHGTAHLLVLEKAVTLRLRNNPYDHIFFIPREFPLESDGVRKEDEEYQRFIESEFLHYLRKFNISYTPITGTIDERVHRIFQSVGG